MSKEKINKIPLWKWSLMLLFFPYGLYHLLFKSKLSWFIRIPVVFLIFVFLILSIDAAINPYRVEERNVKELIQSYIQSQSKEDFGVFRDAERQGNFVWKKDGYVVYRTITTKNAYDFVIGVNDQGKYDVSVIYQNYPVSSWTKEEDLSLPAPPMALVYFYQHQDVLGEVNSIEKKGGVWWLTTKKGRFRCEWKKNKIVKVLKENGVLVLQQKDSYTLPKKAEKFMKKHESEYGKVFQVYGYELTPTKELYYLKTSKGIYRIDDDRKGNIKLFKQESSS